jgi:hypothetical protein
MANSNPPKKNQQFIFYIALEDFANPGSWKTNPTLAAGDFKVSTNGGAEANPGTLPTLSPASGRHVKVTLSTSEMNGDQVSFLWADQTVPKEWADGGISINTTA